MVRVRCAGTVCTWQHHTAIETPSAQEMLLLPVTSIPGICLSLSRIAEMAYCCVCGLHALECTFNCGNFHC
jgi:hypothetical protein